MLSQEYFKQILCGFSHADHCYNIAPWLSRPGIDSRCESFCTWGKKGCKLTVWNLGSTSHLCRSLWTRALRNLLNIVMIYIRAIWSTMMPLYGGSYSRICNVLILSNSLLVCSCSTWMKLQTSLQKFVAPNLILKLNSHWVLAPVACPFVG
jgi:hypothetical protein